MDFKISAQKRDTSTKTSELRKRDGDKKAKIPCVVYGPKVDSTPIVVDYSEFLRLFRQAGTSHVIQVELDKKKIDVLVQEIQLDPVSDEFTHIDFYAIVAGEKITTKVPLIFVDESPAEKLGMMVEHNLSEVEITCLPKDLIGEIKISVAWLENDGDTLHVSDIEIDEKKIEFTIPGEAAIASVHKPRVQIEEEPSTDDATEEEGAEWESEEEAGEASE